MRYIDKSNRYKGFDKYIKNVPTLPQNWEQLNEKVKLKLHQHLYLEQGGLCIYCQQKLPFKRKIEVDYIFSHIEHIRPKKAEKYPYLTFIYCNLSISCGGFDCENEQQANIEEQGEFCGHRKNSEYDEDYFLNPTEVNDIEDYFIYDDLTSEILPKHKEGTEEYKKATYMIKILDLNHKKLIRMREKVVNDIERNGPYEKHDKILPPFYSMLFQLGLL